jgi:hypothetical protein
MAILNPTFTQTVSGSVTITCTGSKNTYIRYSSMPKNRIGTVRGTGGDTAGVGDTCVPVPGDSHWLNGIPYQLLTPARLPRVKPLIGVGEEVRIGDSITTITVPVGVGIHVKGFSPNGNQSHSTDVGGIPGTGQYYIMW